MYTFILILLILDAILLGIVVLLQAGQGGGLAALGGGTTDMVVGGRQAVTILTKGSWVLGGVFLFLSLILSVLSASRGGTTSEVQDLLRQRPAPTAPAASPLENTPSTGGEQAPAQTPAPAGN